MPRKLEKLSSPDESHRPSAEATGNAYTLANLLTPDRVVCNVTARSKKHCLEIVSRLLTNDQETITYSEVFETIYQREKLGSTGIGDGFALPHGRVEELDESVGAFLMLTEAVDFDLDGEEDVDMIFALAVPKDSDEKHLQDLSAIASLLSRTNVREIVGNLTSTTKVYDALMELSEQSSTENTDHQED